jgi:hypothetical protein
MSTFHAFQTFQHTQGPEKPPIIMEGRLEGVEGD